MQCAFKKDDRYYPQVFCKECEKKRKIRKCRYIEEELKVSFNESNKEYNEELDEE